ncbi:FecR family protein [Rhodanobacter caeni]|uniref:FecR family protein n=1 Tax=Rhodanobacter caeni TaxID=657654 RepID=A0ABN0UKI3_9GAMM
MANTTEFGKDPMHTAAIWWTQLRDPEPSTDLLDRWSAWMAADPANAQAFAQLNVLGEAVAHAPSEQRQQLIDEFAPRRAARPRRPLLAAAAAAVIGLALGSWWLLGGRLDMAAPSQQYTSAVGEDRDIQLADGTAVQLGAASTLTTRYADDRRAVDLRTGEAFFTVTHDRDRPFVVSAGPLHIEDLGTAFNVRRTGQRVSVAVTEGRVRLSPSAGASPGGGAASGRLDLVAGQRAEYDPATGAISVSEVAVEHAAAWRRHRLEFVNEPLSAVLANVNRYSRQPIQLADPRLGELMFTGTVNTTTIDSWVGALPHVFPVQVSTFADHVVLSSAGQP